MRIAGAMLLQFQDGRVQRHVLMTCLMFWKAGVVNLNLSLYGVASNLFQY